MIELDGSHGEGGGQVLRSSLTLSLLTGQPFHLKNVRARRPKPGLQAQHLTSVTAAATIGQATVEGARLGSQDLVFTPGQVRPGTYRFAIGTAGATGLVLQTIALPLALAGGSSSVTIEGGTHVKASPCFHFLDITWRAYLAALGVQLHLEMVRPGFYPRGGGVIQATIEPAHAPLNPLVLESIDDPPALHGLSIAAGLPEHVAQRQAHRAKQRLRKIVKRCPIAEEVWPGGLGSVVLLTFESLPAPTAFFALGERGKPAEQVADEAVDQALAYLKAGPAVDPHSADQIVLPLAFAAGPSRFAVTEITQHLLTNLEVIRRFLPRRLECTGSEGQPGLVHVE